MGWVGWRVSVKRAVRVTDEVGWFSKDVAVLLPDTHTSGAHCMAKRLCEMAGSRCGKLNYHVLPYQAQGTSGDDDRGHSERVPSSKEPAKRPAKRRSPVAYVPGDPSLFIQPIPLWKRTTDVILAAGGLAVLSPLLLMLAVLVKATSPGPILFRQWRTGLGGEAFQIYKFRTMVVDAEARKAKLMALNEQDGPAFKLTNDPRLTPVGHLLRSTSLDELPQLWNVLRGDMTLVGPRPLPCAEAAACMPWQRRRLDVTPGITCIWQVKGRSSVSFDQWMRMDLLYTQRRTPWHDAVLLTQTAAAVLTRRGAK